MLSASNNPSIIAMGRAVFLFSFFRTYLLAKSINMFGYGDKLTIVLVQIQCRASVDSSILCKLFKGRCVF